MMTRPYSADLRERIVRAVDAGASRNAVAAQFDVSISFVVKLMQRWRDRGTIAPDRYGGWLKPVLGPHVDLVRKLVAKNNEIQLEELRQLLAAEGIAISISALCRFLKAQGLTRKKRPSMPRSSTGRTSPKPGRPGASVNIS
jgi:putative transposase